MYAAAVWPEILGDHRASSDVRSLANAPDFATGRIFRTAAVVMQRGLGISIPASNPSVYLCPRIRALFDSKGVALMEMLPKLSRTLGCVVKFAKWDRWVERSRQRPHNRLSSVGRLQGMHCVLGRPNKTGSRDRSKVNSLPARESERSKVPGKGST